MVLLAAAVCTKNGTAIISRQFVEMSKSRVEGLLAAFPKLMTGGKQHTFVETDSVRYVYQPMDKLYMLLITTKASNILEDLETLRLFSRVIPEYCRTMDEAEVLDQAFKLLFAFDEIVALGYRESVSLAQIRAFVEMDSHEEKVFMAVRQTQEREALQRSREKAKELQRQRVEAGKRGLKSPGFGGGGFGGSSGFSSSPVVGDSASDITPKPSYTAPSKPVSSNALKLGSKAKDVDSFVDKLVSEGEHVISTIPTKTSGKQVTPNNTIPTEPVSLRVEEKLSLVCGRDGGLQNMEVLGLVTLRITDDKFGKIRVALNTQDNRGVQLQTHPNIDKELFKLKGQVGLKNASKPFPLNSDVGVLKWRFQTGDEKHIPLTINCWPSENGQGGCDVNIEYELQDNSIELHDVSIAIPLVSGTGSPLVNECDGEYSHDSRKNLLLWTVASIDSSNKNGSMEFTAKGRPDDFFPVAVSFVSRKSFVDLQIGEVMMVEDSTPVKHSQEVVFYSEKYEIV